MNQHYRAEKGYTLTAVAIGEAEAADNGEHVAVLTLETLDGPFDFVVTEKAAAAITEAMTTAQAALHGQRYKS